MKAKFPWFNPDLDLFFERDVALPPEKIWSAWTEPDLLMPWFCPRPWSVVACEIDLRPGGTRYTAAVFHGSREHRDVHASMGFEQGWGIALDQMIEFMSSRG